MKRHLLIALFLTLILSGCGARSSAPMAMEEVPMSGAPAMDSNFEMEMPAAAPMADEARNTASSSVDATQQERLVIKNADLSITVDDPEAKIAAIANLAASMGGHVVSSNIYQSYANNGVQVPEGNITIRVPAESLNAALEEIKAGVDEINNETVTGEDITDQYVDLQSRLKAKKAAEEKLLEIMEQANTTEDTLNVYAQLQIIQSDIEVLTGQINYYERSAAMSSITVSVIASEKNQPIEIGGWELGKTASEAVQDLIDYMQGFTRFLIRFIIFILPVLLTLALPFYLVFLGIRALVRRRRAKRAAKAQTVEKEE